MPSACPILSSSSPCSSVPVRPAAHHRRFAHATCATRHRCAIWVEGIDSILMPSERSDRALRFKCMQPKWSGPYVLPLPARSPAARSRQPRLSIALFDYDPDDDTSYERYWPYAAMDYYIQLDSAPDISSFNENSFSEVKSGATCTPLGSDILSN